MKIRKMAYDTKGEGFGPNGHRLFNPYNGAAIDVNAQRAKQLWGQHSTLPAEMSPDEFLSLVEMAEINRRKDDPEKAQQYMEFAQYILGEDVTHLQQGQQWNQGQQVEQSQYAAPNAMPTNQPAQAKKKDWYSKSGMKDDKWKNLMSSLWGDEAEMKKINFIKEAAEMFSESQRKSLLERLEKRSI